MASIGSCRLTVASAIRSGSSRRHFTDTPSAAGKPASVVPGAGRTISAARAFLLNACFVAGLLVLSQLSVLQERPVVRASVVAAALVLLAWSGLLFGVLLRGQRVALDLVLRRQH